MTQKNGGMAICLRAGTPGDAEACGLICFEAFKKIADQHNFPRDFPDANVASGLLSHLFSRGDIYSVVAEVDGRIVGSNFLWENTRIAGVGPITVDPGVQNGTVGRYLMTEVMRRAQERRFAGIRLVQAAYHNRSLALYTKLGFDAREPLSTMQGPAIGLEIPGYTVRRAEKRDVAACNRLCCNVHGHDREAELLEAIEQETATVVESHGQITGYATLIGFFGHAVCENNESLKALIAAAKTFPGPGFLLPTRNSDLLRWCLEHGLRIVQPLTLMSAGLYNKPKGAFLPSIIY